MPGLDLNLLSSNWKSLQAQLPKVNHDASPSLPDLKRKRPADTYTSMNANGKRIRTSWLHGNAKSARGRQNMGTTSSASNTEASEATRSNTKLQERFEVTGADLDGAYGVRNKIFQEDELNGGRHATNNVRKYLALDCEMVGTGPPPHTDNLLARVSIVNFHGQQIYDSYVLPVPGMKVEDYRTHVSGIREQHLKPGYARPFSTVRKEVLELLQGKILIGHALKKDMQVLQFDHPKVYVRDTSRYPPYRLESRGKAPALKQLAKIHLGMSIQQGEHSSLEDARTAMLLYKREKAGFEYESQKQYGTPKYAQPRQKGNNDYSRAVDGEDDDDDDEEEFDSQDDGTLLHAEAELDNHENQHSTTAPSVRKKRKKKKRTKR